jgi:hypothetical protein
MTTAKPIVTADEVFAINKNIRWVGLVTEKGEVLFSQMRPGVQSHSPTSFDEETLSLGPLTLLGVAERYSEYLQGVEMITVWYGLTVEVYSWLGSQVIDISVETGHDEALAEIRAWLKQKKATLRGK